MVGACVLLPVAQPMRTDAVDAWQLRGMATAEDRRGQGIGAAVLAEAWANVGGRAAGCSGAGPRVRGRVLRRHGFVGEGTCTCPSETGIPHQLMYRDLSLGREPP